MNRHESGRKERQAILDFLHAHGKPADRRTIRAAVGGTENQVLQRTYYMRLNKEIKGTRVTYGSIHALLFTPLVKETAISFSRIAIEEAKVSLQAERAKERRLPKEKRVSIGLGHYVHKGTAGEHPIIGQGGQGCGSKYRGSRTYRMI